MDFKEIVRTFVEAVNAQDWDRLEGLVAADFVRHSLAAGHPGVRNREDLVRFLQAEFRTFPDAREEIADMLAEGDRVAVRMRFRGTQLGRLGEYAATGRQVESQYLAIYRIADGWIVEAWAEWDNVASLRQLGHL